MQYPTFRAGRKGMLRRIPSTPLVCLAVFISTILLTASWAAGPDESLDMLLKPNQVASVPTAVPHRAKSVRAASKSAAVLPGLLPYPAGISKVKSPCASYVACLPFLGLPSPRVGQWEMSAQALFARLRGKIQWPRYSQYFGNFQWDDSALWPDLTDQLQLPAHQTAGQFMARYQFRPNWGMRFSVLGFEANGGGWPSVNNWIGYYVFGNQIITYGQQVQSKWKHTYYRLGLVYDAIQTGVAKASVFADWVHVDDRIDLWNVYSGFYTQTFSQNTDSAIVGLEFQKCLAVMRNGGTFSSDLKGGVIFLDDVEGWDAELGGRYSIPLNAGGRWGYVKGGYRVVQLKKSRSDWVFHNTLEGGFMEFGFIF